MKIVMIAPTPFFADRGCHTRIYGEIKGLQRMGHRVILVTYGLGRDVPGVQTVRCYNFPWYRKLSAGPSVWKILLLPMIAHTARKTIRKENPDIVHAHLHEGALAARWCRLFCRRPLYVFDCQGSLSGEVAAHHAVRQNGLGFRVLRLMEKKIDSFFPVVTQSEQMVRQLQAFGVPPEKICNAMDAVDTDLYHPMAPDGALADRLGVDLSRPRVLYMGLLSEYQGTSLMIRAFAHTAKTVGGVQFIIIGYPNEEKYRQEAAEAGIAEQTIFIGKIPYEQTARYLSLSDVAVAPKISLSEGDGKLYNYMAMGMGVACFERSVSKEILGDAGLYAPLGDAQTLGEQLARLLTDPPYRRLLGEKAQKRAEQLSIDQSAKKIDAFYKEQMHVRKAR